MSGRTLFPRQRRADAAHRSGTEETARHGACVVDNLVSWFEGRGALTAVEATLPKR